jgi:hypothetical protein
VPRQLSEVWHSLSLRLPPASEILPIDIAAAHINGWLAGWGFHYQLPIEKVLLPVGISFFTFQSMS